MKSKKKLLKESRLYAVVDKETLGFRPVFSAVKKILNQGVDIIQLRDKLSDKQDILKNAQALSKLLSKAGALLIINDYLDIAKLCDSDGIHLGQGDSSPELARRLLGKDKIIGISCHNLKQALKAQVQGADYISIGPIFSTPTKPGYKAVGLSLIKSVKKKIKVPFFVIGGINEKNIDGVLAYGAKRVAVCRPVCKAKDPGLMTQRLSEAIRRRRINSHL